VAHNKYTAVNKCGEPLGEPVRLPPITFLRSKTLKQRYLYRALFQFRQASPDGLNESEAKKVK